MSNTNPIKPRGWTRVLLKGKQFLFDHWHLPCTSIESICTILLVVNHDVIMGDMHDAREVFQFIPPCFCLSSYYPIFFISLSFFSLAGCLSGLYCFMKLLFQVTFFFHSHNQLQVKNCFFNWASTSITLRFWISPIPLER
jgi:hypothetical protein